MLKPKELEEMIHAHVEKRRKITSEVLGQNKPINPTTDFALCEVIGALCHVHGGYSYIPHLHLLETRVEAPVVLSE